VFHDLGYAAEAGFGWPDSSAHTRGGICTHMNKIFGNLQGALLAIAMTAGANAAVPALLPAVATVHIKDFKYAPPVLTIHAGDRVTFVNDDDEAHTVTATDKSFDSEGLDTAGTWQHVFAKPGTYHYFCELHPYMKATIVVLPASK
jgi:plastocyanin